MFRDPRLRHAYQPQRSTGTRSTLPPLMGRASRPGAQTPDGELGVARGQELLRPGHDKQMRPTNCGTPPASATGSPAIMLSYATRLSASLGEPVFSQLREVGMDLQFIAGSFAEIVPSYRSPTSKLKEGGVDPGRPRRSRGSRRSTRTSTIGAQFQTFLKGQCTARPTARGQGPRRAEPDSRTTRCWQGFAETEELVVAAAKPASQEDRIPLYDKVFARRSSDEHAADPTPSSGPPDVRDWVQYPGPMEGFGAIHCDPSMA